jgi:hypothetical protein
MTFDECCNLAVFAAEQKVALPVPRQRTIFNRGRAFPDGYGVRDSAVILCFQRVMARGGLPPDEKTVYLS